MIRVALSLLATALLFVLAISAGRQDQPEPKVSFEIVATPAPAAVAKLAEATGQKLVAAPTMSSEVIVVRVKDVALSDLLTRIASVTSAKWTKQPDGGLLLEPDAELRNREVAKERQDRLEALKKAVASTIAGSTKILQPPVDRPQTEPVSGNQTGNGESKSKEKKPEDPLVTTSRQLLSETTRLFWQLVLDTNLSRIAELQPGERIVFSSRPTRMQVPATSRAFDRTIDRLIAIHNQAVGIRAEYVRKQAISKPKRAVEDDADLDGEPTPPAIRRAALGSSHAIDATQHKALLICSIPAPHMLDVSSGQRLPSFRVLILDESGKIIYRRAMRLAGADTKAVNDDEAGEGPAATNRAIPGDEPLEFSQVTKDLLAMARQQDSPETMVKPPSKELAERLARPDEFDPLAFADSEALMQTSRWKNMNLVANLPDSLCDIASSIGQELPQTKAAYLANLLANEVVKVEMKGTWISVAPSTPATSRAKRLDRVALRRLFDAGLKKTIPSLGDVAEFALHNGAANESSVALLHILQYAANCGIAGFMEPVDWQALRWYGALNPHQREQLASGRELSFQSMDPRQRELLARLLFGAGAEFVLASDVKAPNAGEVSDSWSDEVEALNRPEDYRSEPTELMPNGIPLAGSVMAMVSVGQCACCVRSDGSPMPMLTSLSPNDYAFIRLMSEDHGSSEVGIAMPDLAKVGTSTTLQLRFAVAAGVLMLQTLFDASYAPDSAPAEFAKMPEDFRKSVEQIEAKIREEEREWKHSHAGGSTHEEP